MKTEARADIERILREDDAASETLEAARARAEQVRAAARERASAFASQRREELLTEFTAESERILAEARSKAQAVLDATRRYLDRQRETKDAVQGEIVEALLEKVVGP